MATQRYISTSFWDDPWIHKLDPSEKLLYLYLMTNTLTNIAGVYKISNDRVSYDTGFNDNTINHILEKFEKARKVFRKGEYIVIPTWPKHQKWETKEKIRKGIISLLNSLEREYAEWLILVGYRFDMTLTKWADMVSIPYDKVSYQSNYSDSDSNLNSDFDSDIDSDSEASAAPTPEPSPQSQRFKYSPTDETVSTRFENHRKAWNYAELPGGRFLFLQLSPDDISAVKTVYQAYDDDEIEQSINNYKTVISGPEYDLPEKYQYGTFVAFLKKGVVQYVDSAKPLEKKRKATGCTGTVDDDDYERFNALMPKEYQNAD